MSLMHMRHISSAVLPTLLIACASGPSPDSTAAARPAAITVPLMPSTAVLSGVGQARLAERKGSTDVAVVVSRVPQGVTLPVHLYTYLYRGSCGRLEPQPERALTRNVLTYAPGNWPVFGGPYAVSNKLDIPLDELRSAPHAILVKSGPADGGMEMYCGNIS